VFTYYAYYLLYIEGRTSKKDRDLIMGVGNTDDNDDDDEDEENINDEEEENEEENEKERSEKEVTSGSGSNDNYDDDEENEGNQQGNSLNEDKLNECNPTYLLSKAMTSKLNIFKSYFVRFLIYEIKEKEKEEKDFYKK